MDLKAEDQILPHSYCCKPNIILFLLIDLCLICRIWFVSRPKSDCPVNFSNMPSGTKGSEIWLKLLCNGCLVNWIFLPTEDKSNEQPNSSISHDFEKRFQPKLIRCNLIYSLWISSSWNGRVFLSRMGRRCQGQYIWKCFNKEEAANVKGTTNNSEFSLVFILTQSKYLLMSKLLVELKDLTRFFFYCQ